MVVALAGHPLDVPALLAFRDGGIHATSASTQGLVGHGRAWTSNSEGVVSPSPLCQPGQGCGAAWAAAVPLGQAMTSPRGPRDVRPCMTGCLQVLRPDHRGRLRLCLRPG